MKIPFYFILFCAFLTASCESVKGPGGGTMSKNYIGHYMEVDTIVYTSGIKLSYNSEFSNIAVVPFEFAGKIISYRGNMDKERFRYYSGLYGDTAYNRMRDMMVTPDVVADRWQSVTLTCDKDYDARHPAGTSLNDIVRIEFRSPYFYIKSGYQDKELKANVYMREKLLSEMTTEDLLLIENFSILKFVSQPLVPAERQFTITWQAENKTIKSTFGNVQNPGYFFYY